MVLSRGFASDNNAGIHPDIMHAVAEVNTGHCVGYGDDPFTSRAMDRFKEQFGGQIEVFFVFTGTAANTLGLRGAAQSYEAVICAETSHLNVDECGAPEHFAGCKLIPVHTSDGKLKPADIEPLLEVRGNEHHSQPRVVSVTQATELGTVYTPDELSTLFGYAHDRGLVTHMDGARLCNAAATLSTGLKQITADTGLDILAFGGTKNGMMAGEAVVFFNRNLAEGFKYIRKQGMQLASKMRFISAQFDAFFTDDLWVKNAEHANAMARMLASRIDSIPGCRIMYPVEANGVFVHIPPETVDKLLKDYFFYVWDGQKSIVRLMTSFDTEMEEIEGFTSRLEQLMKS